MNNIILACAVIYLIIINSITFILYGVDKNKAKKHEWRIREATLMGFAAIGGSVGALLGMKFFHHKTKHMKFVVGVPAILIVQLVLIFIVLKNLV